MVVPEESIQQRAREGHTHPVHSHPLLVSTLLYQAGGTSGYDEASLLVLAPHLR